MPVVRTLPGRRPEMNASMEWVEGAMNGPPYPAGPDRQKDQKGQSRMYYKKWYQTNRGELRLRSLKWWKKNKNKFNFKKDQERRRKYPGKFERKPGGGTQENKNRAQEWRDNQKTTASLFRWSAQPDVSYVGEGDPVFFVQPSTDREGWVYGVDPDAGIIIAWFDQADSFEEIPIGGFFDDADFLTEEDADAVMADLDAAFEWLDNMAERVACRYSEYTMLYEKRPPDTDPSQYWDRGKDRSEGWTVGPPAYEEDGGTVTDNPGSTKVIPTNRDFVNNRAAAKISDLRNGCSSGILERSKNIQFEMMRSDPKNLVWLFNVVGSKGENYRTRIKVIPPKGNIRNVAKADIMASCSCPFWRWQGPEHWASQQGYLYGKPKGSAASPDVRDPDGSHLACKHVIACLDRVSEWAVPVKKASVISVSERDFMISEVVRRYGSPDRLGGNPHADL